MNGLLSSSQSALASVSASPFQDQHGPLSTRQRLWEELLRLPAPAFDRLIVQLLSLSGYLDVQTLRAKRNSKSRQGRSSCGGMDLQASTATDLARAITIVQVKQYRKDVPRRFVDELRGAMLRVGARQGLLVTTSTFSRVAHQAAAGDHQAPIRLIEGEELLDMLFLHHLGVSRQSSSRWSLDRCFFEHLHKNISSTKEAPKHPRTRTQKQTSSQRTTDQVSLFGNQGGGMMWQTHALAGLNTLWMWRLFSDRIGPLEIAPIAVATAFGALLPDLDASESKLKHVKVGGIKPFVPLSNVLHRDFGHRGFLHSFWGLAGAAALASPLLVTNWGRLAFIALLLGYLSHLAADACTKSGIPVLYPNLRRYHLLPKHLRITTGSLAEETLFPVLAASMLLLLLNYLPFS